MEDGHITGVTVKDMSGANASPTGRSL
jgi:hypothetical protein